MVRGDTGGLERLGTDKPAPLLGISICDHQVHVSIGGLRLIPLQCLK